MARNAICDSCGAPVVWAGTLKGKRMPLDRSPNKVKGDYFVTAAASPNGRLLAIRITNLNGKARDAADRHGIQLRQSHYATCPDSDQWSGSTRKERRDEERTTEEAAGREVDVSDGEDS